MVVFRIWGKFASFREPLTISQNISLPIPPKTTVAGMIASILGVEDYLQDEGFFDFGYSVVALSSIRKKSFSQNYINDYTTKTQTQLNNMRKNDFEKIAQGLRDKKNPQKPINRELLLNPDFLIFVKDFKNEMKLKNHLQEKKSIFPFYLGNSEFLGNFENIEVESYQVRTVEKGYINSFVLQKDTQNIEFCEGVRYGKLTFATKLNDKRSPQSYKSVVFADESLLVDNLEVIEIQTDQKRYYCQFV